MIKNTYYNIDYPNDADLYAVIAMEYHDDNPKKDITAKRFYYGWKECKRLGINYSYPDPVYSNNMEWRGKTMTLDEIFTQDEERKAALAHKPITPLKEG